MDKDRVWEALFIRLQKMSLLRGNCPLIINRTKSDLSQGSVGREGAPRAAWPGCKAVWGREGRAGSKALRIPAKRSIWEVGRGELSRRKVWGQLLSAWKILRPSRSQQQ